MDMDKGLGRFSVILVVIGVRGFKEKKKSKQSMCRVTLWFGEASGQHCIAPRPHFMNKVF
jgi:hypothetical protein